MEKYFISDIETGAYIPVNKQYKEANKRMFDYITQKINNVNIESPLLLGTPGEMTIDGLENLFKK